MILVVIDGVAVLAMRLAIIDARGWIESLAKKYYEEKESKEKPKSVKVERKGRVIASKYYVKTKEVENILSNENSLSLRFSRLFEVTAGSPKSELEFLIEVNRRIYGLVSMLTDRELEVIQKRAVEQKSLKETASEMGISAQGVVAFMRSIREKVKRAMLD